MTLKINDKKIDEFISSLSAEFSVIEDDLLLYESNGSIDLIQTVQSKVELLTDKAAQFNIHKLKELFNTMTQVINIFIEQKIENPDFLIETFLAITELFRNSKNQFNIIPERRQNITFQENSEILLTGLDVPAIQEKLDRLRTHFLTYIVLSETDNKTAAADADCPLILKLDKPTFIDFLDTASEHIHIIGILLNNININSYSPAMVRKLYRGFHTIKGEAQILSCQEQQKFYDKNLLDYLVKLSHAVETVLQKIIDENLQFTSAVYEIMVSVIEVLENIVSSQRTNPLLIDEPDIFINKLYELVETSDVSLIQSNGKTDSALYDQIKKNNSAPDEFSIKVKAERLEEIQKLAKNLAEAGEKAVPQNITQICETIKNVSMDIHKKVRDLMQIPINKIFYKFARTVKGLGINAGKKIKLTVKDNNIKLHASTVGLVEIPMMHMIRNAVDHGIESPEVRMKTGKTETGNIVLSAKYLQDNVVITIEDDGKGIPPELIAEKAIAMQIADENNIKNMTDKELYQFIFHPGFSTAENVTEMSGRGVGLDIAVRNIKLLNGEIEVNSELNIGTKIILKVPINL